MIERPIDSLEIAERLETIPVVAILGARQAGKTTLALQFKHDHHFDLENPRDQRRLENPQLALEDLEGLIVIDEVQRKPDLFPLLRYLVDTNPKQRYLLLGSASRDLIRQSSETLAGRIAYYRLGGFLVDDVEKKDMKQLWLRGGMPRSFITKSDKASLLWRENYITTFLERDIPQLGINIPSHTLRRFWMMVCHYHGQVLNYAQLGRSFGISAVTSRRYVDILCGTFMVRVLPPWHVNLKKRQVKHPKLYFMDSGVYHALLGIHNFEQLYAMPQVGSSWEGFALEYLMRRFPQLEERVYFWSTHSGAEVDLFWEIRGKRFGVEFKLADAPKMTKSMRSCLEALSLDHLWVVYPGSESYRLSNETTVVGLADAPQMVEEVGAG